MGLPHFHFLVATSDSIPTLVGGSVCLSVGRSVSIFLYLPNLNAHPMKMSLHHLHRLPQMDAHALLPLLTFFDPI